MGGARARVNETMRRACERSGQGLARLLIWWHEHMKFSKLARARCSLGSRADAHSSSAASHAALANALLSHLVDSLADPGAGPGARAARCRRGGARHGGLGQRAGLAGWESRFSRGGGNAADAAVATALALAVTYPRAGNLGGGGFAVLRLADGNVTSVDFRETAPAAAERDLFLDAHGDVVPARSTVGHLASGVPGTIAG